MSRPIIPIRTVDANGPTPTQVQAQHEAVAGHALAYLRPGEIQLNSLPPLALYVHFPWCVKKCPYCDFNSHEARDGFDEDAYLQALRDDLSLSLPMIWGRRIHSVFIGGGTPSLLSAQGLDRLLSDLRAMLALDQMVEITMEANPGTFEQEKFAAFRQSGINRLSIGIQSFNSEFLQALGRIHDGQQARQAVALARDLFENINLDLMYALPGQNLKQLKEDLDIALGFKPDHLSVYHLTLEPNTYFAKFPPNLPDDDSAAEMQDFIQSQLAQAGYHHYEVSAYARPGRYSQHNLNYWNFGDYLGIGAGAHSKISFPNRITRQMRYKQPARYMEACAQGLMMQEEHEVSLEELPFEFMLNCLRLQDGFPVRLFGERTGLSLQAIQQQLELAEQKGLLNRDHQLISPTPLGRQFLNDLQQIFL